MENEMKTEETLDALIIADSGMISLRLSGESYTVSTDHANYDQILAKLKDQDYAGLTDLIDVTKTINEKTGGVIAVKGGNVYYKGSEIVNPLTDRIIRFIKEGLPFEPMVKFLENLMDNPSRTSVQELYLFLENNELPITPDGHFLAYKKVRGDYKDIHSGTFDNSVGAVCEMPRNQVDDIRENTCSNGLHFCSKEYLPCFGSCTGNKVVVVKINPADVVSIPSDYDNAKGRTARYEVVGDCTDEYLKHLDEHGRIDMSFFEHLEKYGVNDLYDDGDDLDGLGEYTECDACGDEYPDDELSSYGLCPDCEEDRQIEEDELEAELQALNEDDLLYDDDDDDDDDAGTEKVSLRQALGRILGRKPDGTPYHNERGPDGKFKKHNP